MQTLCFHRRMQTLCFHRRRMQTLCFHRVPNAGRRGMQTLCFHRRMQTLCFHRVPNAGRRGAAGVASGSTNNPVARIERAANAASGDGKESLVPRARTDSARYGHARFHNGPLRDPGSTRSFARGVENSTCVHCAPRAAVCGENPWLNYTMYDRKPRFARSATTSFPVCAEYGHDGVSGLTRGAPGLRWPSSRSSKRTSARRHSFHVVQFHPLRHFSQRRWRAHGMAKRRAHTPRRCPARPRASHPSGPAPRRDPGGMVLRWPLRKCLAVHLSSFT